MKRYSDLATPYSGHAIRTRRRLLSGLREPYTLGDDVGMACPQCDGTGLEGPFAWDLCKQCSGYGVVYAISFEELERRRLELSLQYPKALLENWKPSLRPRW